MACARRGCARRRRWNWRRRSSRWSGSPATSARLPSELSGGQQQRVAVARAIVLEPKVLLFDEPLSNLDAKLRRHVREEIRELQQSLSLTAVYVTHDQQEALAISDRIMVMNMARIAQDGTPRGLYEQPNSHFVADFIGDANIVPVTIESHQGDMASVRLGPLMLTLPHHGAVERDGAELSIRPHALQLARGTDGLHGHVAKAAYLGSHMEYWIVDCWTRQGAVRRRAGCRSATRRERSGHSHPGSFRRRARPAAVRRRWDTETSDAETSPGMAACYGCGELAAVIPQQTVNDIGPTIMASAGPSERTRHPFQSVHVVTAEKPHGRRLPRDQPQPAPPPL